MDYTLWRKNKKFIRTYSRLLFIYIWRTSKWRYWNWRDSKKEKTELIWSKSTRKLNKFKFGIKIPNTAFQLENLKPEKPEEKKGVIEYKYKIKMIEKNDDNEDEF